MIIAKIFQGPGNQLFQYAFGLANARRLKTELKLDLSWFKEYSHHRQYILDRFRITAPIATEKEIYDVLTCNGPNFLAYRWNQLNRLHLRPYYQRPKMVEDLTKYDPNLKKLVDNTYVDGSFTNRDFFIESIDEVRQQFQFITEPNQRNRETIDKIRSQNAVALSFRLGDFLKHPHHNVTSIQYYHRCIEYLQQRYSNLVFYIFSDDINWVKNNFSITHPVVYMEYNTPDYMEDFRLLTHFKLHVMPNSTFSWWGALLAPDKDKLVLCPEYWLSPDKAAYPDGRMFEFRHVTPAEWVKIPNMVGG